MKTHRPLRILLTLAVVPAVLVLALSPQDRVAHGQGAAPAEDWAREHEEIANHPEAELLVRHGSINNLTFGWPADFDPFAGGATPAHPFPWAVPAQAAPGTDRITVPSSYKGNPPTGYVDGYTSETARPANNPLPIPITFTPPRFPIRSAILQVFVDDFQSPVWKSKFQVTMNGKRVPEAEEVLNALDQSGPIGKLVTLQMPKELVDTLSTGKLTIVVDDPTTGAGDGYAFDYFRLLINPRGAKYQGTLTGRVTSAKDGKPIARADVSAGGVVQTLTDAEGNFELRGVPAGHAAVRSSALGYRRKTIMTDLLAGESVRVEVTLKDVKLGPDLIEVEQAGLLRPTTRKFRPKTIAQAPPTEANVPAHPAAQGTPTEAVVPPKGESPAAGSERPRASEKSSPAADETEDEEISWLLVSAAVGGLLGGVVLLLVLINRRFAGLVVTKQACTQCKRVIKVRGAALGKQFRCPGCGTVQSLGG